MQDRRLVGIDLGITSAHTVRVLAGDGGLVCRRKAIPTVESLGEVEQAALAGAAAGTRLEVVVEPTGPAWLPIAVFFSARGHTVYRVSSAKAHDLRRFLRRHAKSNGIDADTLARLPLVDPAGLHPLQLPDAARAALDRRVRACDRLTRQAADHKRRIKGLVRQLLPASPLVGELGQADLAVLERWADPKALVAVGRTRLQRVLASASAGQQGTQRAEQWLAAAHAALELYGDHPAIAFQELAAEVHQRGPAAARHPGRAGRPRQGAGGLLPPGRPGRAGPQPARPGHHRRARPGRHHGHRQPLRHRGQVPLLHRPGPHEHPRPARPTAKANPSPRPATGCCGPPWSAPPTTPAAKTPSSPASTGPRWSSAAKTTWGRSVWSPPTWPSAPGRSWTAARPTSSATPTPPPSPPPRPSRSSPTTGPCLRRSAGGGAQEGEGPSTSPARTCAWRSRRNEATLPLLGHSWPTTQPRQADPASTLTAKPP